MKVLLIWDHNPERISLCVIENPTEHQLKMLEDADGLYINSDDETEGLAYLNIALADPKYCDGEPYAGIWMPFIKETPILEKIDRVYLAGFCA